MFYEPVSLGLNPHSTTFQLCDLRGLGQVI